jgi:hypothetical protein
MFTDDHKITVEAPTIAGTSTIDSAAYDMAGFQEICCICRMGTPAANNNIRARQDVASGGAYADLKDTLVTHATNNQLMLGLGKTGKQFIKFRVTRGTSTTIDALIIVQTRARTRPVTQPTSTSEQYISPIEGTA